MRETTNSEDSYAVAVMCNSVVLGHVLRKMSAAYALFLRRRLPHTHMRYLELCTRVCYEIHHALLLAKSNLVDILRFAKPPN